MTLRKRVATLAVVAIAAGTATAFATSSGPLLLGAPTHTQQTTYWGFYDGHKDAYYVTDVSSKSQATALGINLSKELATVKGAPDQYFIKGKAAPGQLAVFGSEPGETDYNPLWEEIFVTWKPGVKPVVLKSDNQINALASKHKLTKTDAHIVLNAPIVKVGK